MQHSSEQKFQCDNCGGDVGISNGWVEWIDHGHMNSDIHLTHNDSLCRYDVRKVKTSGGPLIEFVGIAGISRLTRLGQDDEWAYFPEQVFLMIRKLFVPGCEEIRITPIKRDAFWDEYYETMKQFK